jgi:hypothetical protein
MKTEKNDAARARRRPPYPYPGPPSRRMYPPSEDEGMVRTDRNTEQVRFEI